MTDSEFEKFITEVVKNNPSMIQTSPATNVILDYDEAPVEKINQRSRKREIFSPDLISEVSGECDGYNVPTRKRIINGGILVGQQDGHKIYHRTMPDGRVFEYIFNDNDKIVRFHALD